MIKSLIPSRRYLVAVTKFYVAVAIAAIAVGLLVVIVLAKPMLALGFVAGVATGSIAGWCSARVKHVFATFYDVIYRVTALHNHHLT